MALIFVSFVFRVKLMASIVHYVVLYLPVRIMTYTVCIHVCILHSLQGTLLGSTVYLLMKNSD